MSAAIGQRGHTQSILADRADGVPGNCVQAAVATLLDLPLDAVPHFLLWDRWNHVLSEWLTERGYRLTCRFVKVIPDERCIVAGMSPRGVAHTCVGEGGQVVWDPQPQPRWSESHRRGLAHRAPVCRGRLVTALALSAVILAASLLGAWRIQTPVRAARIAAEEAAERAEFEAWRARIRATEPVRWRAAA